jgi:pimeloyl-ACP methyl ester carboxylesterase
MVSRNDDLKVAPFERISFRGGAGSALRTASVATEAPRVLFIHPANLQASTWWRVGVRLPETWSCAAIDLSGHGDSVRSPDYGVAAWTQESVDLLDALGWDDVHLVGASVGAAVVARLAVDHPERVRSVTCVGGAFRRVPDIEIDVFLAALGLEGAVALLTGAVSQDAGMTDDLAAAAQADLSANPDEQVRQIWSAAAIAEGLIDAAGVRCPTLAIVGEQDLACPVEDSAAFARDTGGRLHVLLGHGHLPMYTAADAVAELIARHVTSAVAARHGLEPSNERNLAP